MDVIKEINEKYQALEAEVDKTLEKVKREEEKLAKTTLPVGREHFAENSAKLLSYEDAMLRNAQILKSLEIAKARLRSRTTFSPVEDLLQKAIYNYKRDLIESQADALRNAQEF